MTKFPFPPYEIGEVARAVKRLGELTGVQCRMHEDPSLEADGWLSQTAISDNIVRIGARYGIYSRFTNELDEIGKQFQSTFDALVFRGVVKREDF